jgi:hypothetical protein
MKPASGLSLLEKRMVSRMNSKESTRRKSAKSRYKSGVRFVVLRFHGDELDPAELTAILGTPTRAYAKGEPVGMSLKRPFLGRTGMWSLSTRTLDLGPDIGTHLAYIWGRVEPHLDALEKFASTVTVDLQATYEKSPPKRKQPIPVLKPRFERLGIHELTL